MTRLLRTIALMLSMLTLTTFSSCKLIDEVKLSLTPATEKTRGIPDNDESEYVRMNDSEYKYSPNYTPIDPRHSYRMLSDGQKKLYDELLNSVRDIHPDSDEENLFKTKQVVVNDELLSSAQIRVAAKALYDDNPDLFWLSGTIYQMTNESEGYTAVQMRSIYSPDEIILMQEKIRVNVDRFYASVPADLDAYEREKYVHDYINDVCEYDTEAAKAHTALEKTDDAYNIYGTLVLRKSVCEGYSRTMQLLLCGLGVDCIGITGMGTDTDGSRELHMWNAVDLGGDWYYVDPTWDDQSNVFRRYQYFNLDETMLNQDHENSRTLDDLSVDEINGNESFSAVAMNLFVPDCVSTEYNYYIYECPHLTDYDGAAITDGLYRAAQNRDDYFIFYIDPNKLDYDEALRLLFSESPQYFFTYIGEVNTWMSDVEIDNSNLTYYGDEKRNTVTVEMHYY